MEPKRSYLLTILFILTDLLVLSAVYFLSSIIWATAWSQEKFVFQVLFWFIPLSWAIISFMFNVYNDRMIQIGRSWNIRKISIGFISMVAVILLVVVFGKFKISRSALILFLLLDWVSLLGSGYVRNQFLGFIRSKGFSPRSIAFIGDEVEIQTLREWIAWHPERGFQDANFVEFNSDEPNEILLDRITGVAENKLLLELALGSFNESYPATDDIVNLAEEYGLRVYLRSNISLNNARRLEETL